MHILHVQLELMGQQNVRWSLAGCFSDTVWWAGTIAVLHMNRTDHPLIDFACLKVRTFSLVIWGGSLFRIAIAVSPFLLPLMFQLAFGMSAFQSGLLVLALFAGNLGMKTVTTPILRRFGFRSVLVANGLITAALIFSFSLIAPGNAEGGHRCAAVRSRPVAINAVHQHQHAGFRGHSKIHDEFGEQFLRSHAADEHGHGRRVGAVTLRMAMWIHGGFSATPATTDFHLAFVLVSIIAVLAVVDCFNLAPHAGAEVSGRKA